MPCSASLTSTMAGSRSMATRCLTRPDMSLPACRPARGRRYAVPGSPPRPLWPVDGILAATTSASGSVRLGDLISATTLASARPHIRDRVGLGDLITANVRFAQIFASQTRIGTLAARPGPATSTG